LRELSVAFQSDKQPDEYVELAVLVEGYGFDVLSLYSDLMYQPPIVPLTLAAQATSRIRLGPASLNPYTLHPVEIAGQIATLDQVSQGRAYLGLSRGAWLDSLGIEQRDAPGRLAEAIDVVQRLLRGDDAGYAGRHFRLAEHQRLNYHVLRPEVPLLLGAWGRRMVRLAGARAAELKLGGSANPAMLPLVLQWLAEGERGARREAGATRIVMGAVTIVDEDRSLARGLIRRELALYLPVVAVLDPTVQVEPELLERVAELVARGDRDSAGALIPDDLLDRFAFSGTPADVVSQCEALFEAGVGRIEFGTPHGVTPRAGLQLLGERVLPALVAVR
jgi:5,10-methylenetetrahydromethanopterin reductase